MQQYQSVEIKALTVYLPKYLCCSSNASLWSIVLTGDIRLPSLLTPFRGCLVSQTGLEGGVSRPRPPPSLLRLGLEALLCEGSGKARSTNEMNSSQLRKIANGYYFVIEVMFGKGRGKAHSTNVMNFNQLRKHINGQHFAKGCGHVTMSNVTVPPQREGCGQRAL